MELVRNVLYAANRIKVFLIFFRFETRDFIGNLRIQRVVRVLKLRIECVPRNGCKVLVGKPGLKGPLRRLRRRRKNFVTWIVNK